MKTPLGWKREIVNNVSVIQTGLAKGKAVSTSSVRLPYLRVANVQDGFLDLTEIKEIEVEQSQIERYRLFPGDILLTEGGDRDKLGRGTLWEGQIPLCLHQNHIFVVRANENIIFNKFLAYLFSSPLGKKYFLSCAKQSTNLASINSTQLRNFPVVFPAIQEQKAIAAILSTWDEAIEKTERLIACKERHFGWLVNELIGKRKAEVSLAELCPPEEGNKLVKDEEKSLGYLEIGDIDVKTKDYQIDNKDKRPASGAVKVPANTLLISTVRPTRGAITRTKSELYVSSAFCKLRLLNDFYFYCLYQKKFLNFLKYRQSGATYPTVKDKDILTFKIPVLSEAEQKKIIRILNSAKHEIDSLEKLSDVYRMQKQGLMQKLLIGKWRVNFKEEK